MSYLSCSTLGTSEVERMKKPPHLWKAKNKIPKFSDKEKFRKWCVDPGTEHCFISLVEGLNPHNKPSGSNPPHKIHGYFGDYDNDRLIGVDTDTLIAGIKKKDLGSWEPTWIYRTYSGKVRLVWEFETPLFIDNQKLSDKIMDAIVRETKSRTVIRQGGWDECSANPAMMWEIGKDWKAIGKPVPTAALEALFYDAAKKTGAPRGRVNIPLDVVSAKVQEDFPQRWVGEFDIGARGPLFWIDDGIDRVGCVVQDGGMWSFSTRATKSFTSWAEIFGEKFVSEYRENQLQEAIEDTWFDGKKYWIKDGRDTWSPIVKEDFITRLRLAGFSHKSRKQNDPASQIDEVLVYVQDHRRIHGAAPFLFDHREIVEKNQKKYINTHAHLRVMEPATTGDITLWPNLHEWWTNWMTDQEAIHKMFAWMQRFYRSCYNGHPEMGHSLIIAGDHDQGKSLFSTYILPLIFSGGADCGRYMMGLEAFNNELTESPIWYIDDNTSGSTMAEHRRFSEMLKKMSATPKVTARAMYSPPVDIDRRGRIILTTNTDADSLAILPNLDGTILDKLMIFKLNEGHVPWFKMLHQSDIEDTIKKELPHFLAWLLHDYNPPEIVFQGATGRYGIAEYHHRDIVSIAKDLNPDQRDWEMLLFWWAQYTAETKKTEWEGNISALLGEFTLYENLRPLTQTLNKIVFTRTMAKFSSMYPHKVKRIVEQAKDQPVVYKLTLDV